MLGHIHALHSVGIRMSLIVATSTVKLADLVSIGKGGRSRKVSMIITAICTTKTSFAGSTSCNFSSIQGLVFERPVHGKANRKNSRWLDTERCIAVQHVISL